MIARVNTHLTIYRLKREVQEQRDELEHELRVVAEEQRKLLPDKLPRIDGLNLSVHYKTSRFWPPTSKPTGLEISTDNRWQLSQVVDTALQNSDDRWVG